MKTINSLFLLFVLCIFPYSAKAGASQSANSNNSKNILMVVSGYGVDQGETLPGYEFDEFSKAYLIFKANGLSVDIASPNGGKVVADKYNPEKPFNAQVLQDKAVMTKLEKTLKISDLKADDYAGIFVVGGKGAMFDLPKDKSLQKLIAKVYENNGSISAVCHGPAALVDVKLSNGQYLVSGKRVNGFTNQEEKAFGKKWVKHFDFMLEDKLAERGGKFESSSLMLPHATVDGRLITGQNPFSTARVAESFVKSLGITLIERESFKDDRTMYLVERLLRDEKGAKIEFLKHSEKYQPELIGMYGYYALQFAENNKQIDQAVNLMQLASPIMKNPQLDMFIAQGQLKLGKTSDAKTTLQQIIEANPEMEAARKMLDTIN